MYDQEIPALQVKAGPFPFPCEGDVTLAVRNKNYALGPVMVHIVMKPGSVIRRTGMMGWPKRST